jgi:hypothetical protein
MGNKEAGVSHFLCPEYNVWLPNQEAMTLLRINGTPKIFQ